MEPTDRWEAVDAKRRSGEAVEGEVTDVLRGGLVVATLGLRAFLPPGQVAPDAGDWRTLAGRRIHVQVLEVNRRRNRVIVRQTDQ